MSRAAAYLEEASCQDLLDSKTTIIDWLLLAEQLRLSTFITKCANQAALNYDQVKFAANFNQLSFPALKAIMEGLHLLRHARAGVSMLHQRHNSSMDTLSAADFAIVRPLQAKQVYMCKCSFSYTTKYQGMKYGTCPGHHGSWTWDLQKQVWQLDSNPVVVTKILPTDVLELAILLGSLPTHQLSEPTYQYPGM